MTNPRRPALKRAWSFFTRPDVAAILIFAVLLLATLGSFFPQLPSDSTTDPERLAQWEAGVKAKYGALAKLLARSGAFRCFRSPVFLIPLALLALATLACTLNRWRGLWRRAFRQPIRRSDAAFESAPHSAAIALPDTRSLNAARERLRQRGFRVQTEVAADVAYLRGDRNRLTPLATLVTHLALLLLLLGAALSGGCG